MACMHHWQPYQQRRRANLAKAPRPLLLLVDSPEPSEVLLAYDLGVQWALEDRPLVPRRVSQQGGGECCPPLSD